MFHGAWFVETRREQWVGDVVECCTVVALLYCACTAREPARAEQHKQSEQEPDALWKISPTHTAVHAVEMLTTHTVLHCANDTLLQQNITAYPQGTERTTIHLSAGTVLLLRFCLSSLAIMGHLRLQSRPTSAHVILWGKTWSCT